MSRTAPQAISQLFKNPETLQTVVEIGRKYPLSLSTQDWYISGMDSQLIVDNPDVHNVPIVHFQVGDLIAMYCFYDGEFRVLISKEGHPDVGGTVNVGMVDLSLRVSSFPEIVFAFFDNDEFLKKVGKDFEAEFCADMKILSQSWELAGVITAYNLFFRDYYTSIPEMFFPTDVYATREPLTFHDSLMHNKEVEEACQSLDMSFRIHKDFMVKQVIADVYEDHETIIALEIEDVIIRATHVKLHGVEKNVIVNIGVKDGDQCVVVVGDFTAEGIMMSAKSLIYRMFASMYDDTVEEFLQPLMTPNHFRLLRTLTRFPELTSSWAMVEILSRMNSLTNTENTPEGGIFP